MNSANQDDYDRGPLIMKIALLFLLLVVAFYLGVIFEKLQPENNPPDGMPYVSTYLELYQLHQLSSDRLRDYEFLLSECNQKQKGLSE